jgi:hypothetical protein
MSSRRAATDKDKTATDKDKDKTDSADALRPLLAAGIEQAMGHVFPKRAPMPKEKSNGKRENEEEADADDVEDVMEDGKQIALALGVYAT